MLLFGDLTYNVLSRDKYSGLYFLKDRDMGRVVIGF